MTDEAATPAPAAPAAPAPRERLRRAAPWLAVGLLGLVTQGLAASPALYAGPSDAASYVALARGAPSRALFDGREYVLHPPLHPLLIRATSLVTGLGCDRAGVVLAAACTVCLGLLTFGLARRALDSTAGGLAAAALLLASRGAVFLGQGTWREPLQTLLVYGLLALLVLRPPSRGGAAAGVALAALGGLLWDPLVLLAPLLLGGGVWLRRPALLAAAAALVLVWGGWALHRRGVLAAEAEYPAGIDGLVEETRDAPAAALLNPNFLPRTARHNAFFWGAEATPLRPLELAAPWFAADEAPWLEVPPGAGLTTACLALLALAVPGLLLVVDRAREAGRLRELAVALACVGLLGAPAALGRTPRYGYAWLPLVALLCGAVVARLERRAGSRRAELAGLGLALAVVVAWVPGHRHCAWTRAQRFDGEGVAAWLAAGRLGPELAVAAPVGLTQDLCWVAPGARVVTLPLGPDGLERLLVGRRAPLVVLPFELAVAARPGRTRAEAEEAQGVPAVRAVHAAVAAGRATRLGTVVEAEVTDRPRARLWDLFWWPEAAGGAPAPAPFGLFVAPGAEEALRAALAAGAVSPQARALLAQRSQ